MTRAAQLSEVAEVNPALPGAATALGADVTVPFIPMSAVSEDGTVSFTQRRTLSSVRQGYSWFRRGDVVLAKITPCFENGKAAHLAQLPSEVGFGSTEFHVIRPGPQLDGRYLSYLLRSPAFRKSGEASMTGSAGQKRVPASFVRSYQVPLPSLSEQRRIAAVLEAAGGIRRKRQESVRLLDEFLRSAFREMFGDPVRNEKGWEVVRLGERLSFVTSGSRGWAKYYADSGRPFLRIQNVGHNELVLQDLAFVSPPASAEADRTTVRAGDLLLSITADLGRTAVVTPVVDGGHINQHLALLRLKALEPLYVAEFLASAGGRRQFERLNRQAVKAGLNFDDIRSLKVLVPPTELQVRFAELFRRRERASAVLHEALDEAHALFDSLATGAFRGEL